MGDDGIGMQPSDAHDIEELRAVETEADARACYPLMHQLRPHLDGEREFITRWRRQTAVGYRLLALWRQDRPVALAGFRVQDNLMHGVHLYVDDLVTDQALRGSGYGQRLMERLSEEARVLGCAKLILDTPLTNTLGHRFYYRQGLLATALRFNLPIAPAGQREL